MHQQSEVVLYNTMKDVRFKYTVTFEGTIKVPNDATLEDIEAIACDIDIPENKTSEYQANSFELVRDDDEELIVYDNNAKRLKF